MDNPEIISTNTAKKKGFPKHVCLIILNEFCERFSYYGIRTVLILYLTKFILIDDGTATAIYSAFTVICYFTPVIGAIISDGYIGKFKTILYLSIVYLIGEIILCLTSFKPLGAPNLAGPLVGLIVIGLGTGGIKPCVSAFGGDQFLDEQKKQLNTFFSVFYMSINLGSFISTLLTPSLRTNVSCFSGDCYPLSFGVPAFAMFIAIIVFLIGKPLYYSRPVDKTQNVICKLTKCICYALKTKFLTKKVIKKAHWLDYSDDNGYDKQFISDAKQFSRVIFMFVPLPIFWALFDQQGSRWTLQATKMDTKLRSDSWIQADQIQAVNAILILLLVPIFNWIIYPLFEKCNLFKKQLSRMAFGMVLAGLSFCASALVEYKMQTLFMNKNSAPHTIQFTNLAPFSMNISSNEGLLQTIEPLNQFNYMNTNGQTKSFTMNYKDILTPVRFNFSSSNDKYLKNNYLIYFANKIIQVKPLISSIKNPPTAKTELRIFFLNIEGDKASNYLIESKPEIVGISIINLLDTNMTENYLQANPSLFDFKFINFKNDTEFIKNRFILDNGASSTFILTNNLNGLNLLKIIDIYENQLSFGYQMIQYFIVTCAEVMFSISGLSFAYSQAPESMKSVLQAAWLLTVGFGNIIVIIIAGSHFFENQLYEYVLFAALIFIFTIIFGVMSHFYIYDEALNYEVLFRNNDDIKSSDIQLIRVKALNSN
jgi:dipeptide/tripeptide permease